MSTSTVNRDAEAVGRTLKNRKAKVCIVGIGGISTSAIAEHLHRHGYTVWGSDDGENENTARLRKMGISVTRENRRVSVFGADIVAYSLAVGEGCPPLHAARAAGIPTVRRSVLLGEIMKEYGIRIGVSGTHGKSTTTALAAEMLRAIGERPTVFDGAILDGGSPYIAGDSKYLVFEACEYRDSFLDFHPTDLVVTNVERDHTDYFETEEALLASFYKALSQADRAIINADDPLSRSLLHRLPGALTYGMAEEADVRYTRPIPTKRGNFFTLSYRGERIKMEMPTLSLHDCVNAVSAACALVSAGVPFSSLEGALKDFRGLLRRCELLRYIYGRPVYYDYAHHPTEIRSTLNSIRDRHGSVTVIFRPHTYTRTRDLWDGFIEALSLADYVGILNIYAAREEPIPDVNSERLAAAVGGRYLTADSAAAWAVDECKGAIVLMGAGDVEGVKRDLLGY